MTPNRSYRQAGLLPALLLVLSLGLPQSSGAQEASAEAAATPPVVPRSLQLDGALAAPPASQDGVIASEAKLEPKAEPKPEPKPEPKAEPKAESKPEPEPKVAPVPAVVAAEPEAKAAPEAVPPPEVVQPSALPPSAMPLVEVGEVMDIGKVLEKVFTTHPLVQQAAGEVEASRHSIESARAGYYPYLQVQSALASKAEQGSTTLSVVQPLWDGGLTSAQMQEAKERRRAAFINLTQVRLNLSQEVLSAVFDILGAESQLALWDQYITGLKASQSNIERRAKSGVAPESDVQTVMVRISLAEAGRESARTQRIAARSRLSSLMSELPPPLKWPDEKSRLKPEDLGGLLARVDEHPNLLADREAVDIQKAITKGTKSSLWPQLSLQHRQQLSGDRFDPTNDSTLFVLQYQTSSGVRAYQNSKSAEARVGSAERKADATRAALQAQFRSDTAQLLAYATQVSSQGRAASAATGLVESYQRQFEVGRKTWLELLNALREAHESRLQAANLERAYWQTNLKLVLQATLWDRLGLGTYLDPEQAAGEAQQKAETPFWSRFGIGGDEGSAQPAAVNTEGNKTE